MVVRRRGIPFLLFLFLSSGIATAQSPAFSRVDLTTGLALWEPIVSGDFNGDGFPDIIVASRTVIGSSGVFGIHLLAGRGDGTFASPVLVASPDVVIHLVSADLTSDDALDLLFIDGDNVRVLPGNGDGTFRDAILSPRVLGSRPPIFADVDNDGTLDLVFVTQDGFVSISPGRGDGSFGSPSLLATADGGRADHVAAGDFNGDGNLDLAVSNIGLPDLFAGSTVALFLGRGNGSFHSPTEFPVAMTPGPLAAADFDQDGHLDVGVISYRLPLLSLLRGAGDGTFLPHMDYATTGNSGIAAADFNGDGRPDLAVCGGGLSVFTSRSNATFGDRVDIAAPPGCNSTAVADFNLDGRPDLALLFAGGGEVLSVFLNTTVPADTTGPLITVSASPNVLWPANGQTVSVTASGTVTDAGVGVDPASVTFTVLDEYGIAQPTGPIAIDTTGHYSVRIPLTAFRRGDDSDGRRYTIVVHARDLEGNAATASTLVVVSHDRRASNRGER
jgi:hypothetical protein